MNKNSLKCNLLSFFFFFFFFGIKIIFHQNHQLDLPRNHNILMVVIIIKKHWINGESKIIQKYHTRGLSMQNLIKLKKTLSVSIDLFVQIEYCYNLKFSSHNLSNLILVNNSLQGIEINNFNIRACIIMIFQIL